MTGRPPEIQTMLNKRLSLIQAISTANCEHMRLTQIASGMMILDQMHEMEGSDTNVRSSKRDENADALERCMNTIETLETELAQLDGDLATSSKRDEE
jgi:hypothetical protein